MPRKFRDFFAVGKQYRAPMFVASSFEEHVAAIFLSRLDPWSEEQSPPHQEPVLWTFHFDASLPENRRCVNVNFIDKNDGTVGNEDEFLFSPYSAFKVRAVHWEEEPIVNEFLRMPHRIEVDVAPDNMTVPLDLPLAPWC
jgi:hypothetical protein